MVSVGLALFVVSTFVAVVVGGGALLGVDGTDTGLMLIATAIIAVAFEPVRGRLAVLGDRVVFGARLSSWQAVSRLASEMGYQHAPDRLLATLAEVIGTMTGSDSVVVWLRVDQTMMPVAGYPVGDQPDPVMVGDGDSPFATSDLAVSIPWSPGRGEAAELGAVTVAGRGGGEGSATEEKLIEDLASAASTVIRTVQLRESRRRRLQLADRQQEALVGARWRTAEAQLAERQRLERDLHDSGQQRAVVVAAKLGLARTMATADPDQAVVVLEEIEEDLDRLAEVLAEATVGRLLPDLVDGGVGAAIQARTADLGVHVDVIDEVGPTCPPAVAEAVYACCMEAVQNSLKHAAASRLEVRLHREHHRLCFEIVDDGVGFEVTRSGGGTGLAGMSDRLASLGGRFWVRSGVQGTTVRGQVPWSEAGGG